MHLLLTYLVHQIEAPSLPDSLRLSRAAYLEAEALPLWEEKAQALDTFKVNVVNLSDAWTSPSALQSLLLSYVYVHVYVYVYDAHANVFYKLCGDHLVSVFCCFPWASGHSYLLDCQGPVRSQQVSIDRLHPCEDPLICRARPVESPDAEEKSAEGHESPRDLQRVCTVQLVFNLHSVQYVCVCSVQIGFIREACHHVACTNMGCSWMRCLPCARRTRHL